MVSEAKLESWIQKLSSNVPLEKLVNTIPHGFKAGRLLDLLFRRATPIRRALWFIKVSGANELGGNNSIEAQQSFSFEWTDANLKFISKIIDQLSDETKRAASLGGWKYFVEFSKLQYNEGLLDRGFLKEILELFKSSKMKQVF